MDQLEKQTLIQKLANATKTNYGCGGHYKAKMNEEKMAEYTGLLRNAGEEIPNDDELLKIGKFNGEGSY
jgi:hypothetical protein